MKKILVIIALLTSTLLNAHGSYHSSFFNRPALNDNFWHNFERQMDKLKHKTNALGSYSKQYFDKNTNSYTILLKTSNIDKNNIEIESKNNKLMISAKQTVNNQNTYSSNSFSQVVSIPKDGDLDNITADFKDGILKVLIPKLKQPKSKTRQIMIK